MDISKMPLPVVADCFRNELFELVGKYQQLGVPAFVLEGIISEAVADIRQLRAKEVADGYAQMMISLQEDDQEKTEEPEETNT